MRKINSVTSTNLDNNSHNFKQLPSISAFPKDEKIWRIDWFGEITFPNRLIRRTQPSILVHLSRIQDERFLNNTEVQLSPHATSPAKFQRKTWVSVGTLPLLRIGDLWQNGQLVAQPDYELEQFSDLCIDRVKTHLIKAGLNLNEQGFLLPLTEHPWHMHCTQSYCLLLKLEDNKRLIIPCVELIRFYFGSSSNLITKLFLPPLEHKSLYTKADYDKVSGRLHLQLAEHISGASAADIGRIHRSPIAWQAAVQIGASILAASVARHEIHAHGFFPFEGKTDLTAVGKWLSFQGDPRATFVVYSLRSCSHPFPFRSLQYDVKGHSLRSSHKNSSQANAPGMNVKTRSADDSPDQQLIEKDASSKLAKKTRAAWWSARFPDLTRKAIWKNRALSEPSANNVFCGTRQSDVQHSSVGNPSSERRAHPVDFEIRAKQKSEFPAPEFLREIIEELESLDGFNIQLLTNSEQDGWTIPITVLVNEDGEIDASLFIKIGENQLRERRVAVFSVEYETECVKIVAVESSPTHMKLYLPSSDSETDLMETLLCAAADFISRPEPKVGDISNLIRWVFGFSERTKGGFKKNP
ncbi:hypothetical protein H8K47_16715 [Undibacterium sp. CY7W]|uniref:TnsE C-terminal domain-containing protein n=1 Tax=Undibacterium rugosum TaxID=2762291 RepID=A0A923I7E7_9BURK|nr:hypothetical protein [Undibacterium rugosum]MBC3937001.1 hypothetical protein [Undibacterium rugosum]